MRDRNSLIDQLLEHGLGPGDWLAVFGDVAGARQTSELDRLIRELTGAIGPDGHVLAPTFSSGDQFDSEITPATTGRLAERFRAWPGVARSRHPLHSVAVWGPRALEVIRDHDLYLPFHIETPLGQLVERDGKILMFGVDQRLNPVIHVARLAVERERPAIWVCVHVATEFGGTRKKRFIEAPCARAYARLSEEFMHRGIARTLASEWGEVTWMPARAVFDYVMNIERSEPERLLCEEAACRWCKAMRRLLAKPASG